MTTGKDDFDDTEFEAFLKGQGELAQKLRAMPQPAPSAELDAAILAQVEVDLARENTRPKAANDPFIPKSWRAPLATAACAALVFVLVMWDDSLYPKAPDWRGEEPAAPAAAPAPSKEKAKSDAREALADKAPPQLEAGRSEARAVEPAKQVAPEAYPAEKRLRELTPAAPTSDTSAKPAETEGLVSSTAHESAPPPAVSEVKRAPVAAAASVIAARTASVDESMNRDSPAAWLRLIEHLLNADASKNALLEWDKFRAVHPNYPAPEKLETQIKALKK